MTAPPSHILQPEFYYEFIVYKNNGGSSSLITTTSGSNNNERVWSGYGQPGGYTTRYFDVLPFNKYYSTTPFILNQIYILTREASVVNSLYLDFTVQVTTPSVHFL